jgi:hypothetical protein
MMYLFNNENTSLQPYLICPTMKTQITFLLDLDKHPRSARKKEIKTIKLQPAKHTLGACGI